MATDDVMSFRRGWAGSLEATTQSDHRTLVTMAEGITRRLTLLQKQLERLMLAHDIYDESIEHYGLYSKQARQIKREKLDVLEHLLAFHTIHLEDEMHLYVAHQGDATIRFYTDKHPSGLTFSELHDVITHGTKTELMAFLCSDAVGESAEIEDGAFTESEEDMQVRAFPVLQRLHRLGHMRDCLSHESSEHQWVEYLLESRQVRRAMDAYLDDIYAHNIVEISLAIFERDLRMQQGVNVADASFNRIYLALVAEEDLKLAELHIQLVEPATKNSLHGGISVTDIYFSTRILSP